MSGMVEVIQKIVENELKKIYITEIGVVTSIFSHKATATRTTMSVTSSSSTGIWSYVKSLSPQTKSVLPVSPR